MPLGHAAGRDAAGRDAAGREGCGQWAVWWRPASSQSVTRFLFFRRREVFIAAEPLNWTMGSTSGVCGTMPLHY